MLLKSQYSECLERIERYLREKGTKKLQKEHGKGGTDFIMDNDMVISVNELGYITFSAIFFAPQEVTELEFYKMLNRLNRKFKYIKVYKGKKGKIKAEYNMLYSTSTFFQIYNLIENAFSLLKEEIDSKYICGIVGEEDNIVLDPFIKE